MPELWIPSGTGTVEFLERKSRFIGEGCRVETPDDARARVKELKLLHPRARHVAWAFVMGTDAGLRGLSDDGEPHGTAGRPIMDPIIGAGLTNTLVTVVRYYGGIKLGTGGLTSAYGRAGKEALDAMPKVRLIVRTRIELKLDYSLYDYILRLSKEIYAVIINVKFESAVTMQIEIPETQLDEFNRRVGDAGSGSVLIRSLQEQGDY